MGICFLGGGYHNGVVYIRFEVAGGCNLATCEAGLVWAKSAKPEPQELGFG